LTPDWLDSATSVDPEVHPQHDERFRSLVQNARDGIVIADENARLTYVSPSVERLMGYSPNELLEKVGFDFVSPESIPTALDYFSRISGSPGSSETFEVQIVHKKGNRIWVEATLSNLLEDPHVNGIVTNFHDITERKLAESRLSELEQKYRSLVEDLPAVVYISQLGEEGTWDYVSPQVESMLGFSAQDWMTNPRTWFEAIHPDDRDRVMHDEARADELDAGATIVSEYRVVKPNGPEIWVRDEFRLLSAPDERPRLVRGVITDITDTKEAERLAEQLRQSQKMEAIGQLAGGVAHDFNNLLLVIQNCAQFIAEELPLGDSRRKDAEEIIEAGDRAGALIRQLLTFSRKELVNPQVLDLNEIVTNIERLLRRTIGENIDLETSLGRSLASVTMDRIQVEQVILNLAVNAKDAMPGGGRLGIQTSNVYMEGRPGAAQPDPGKGRYVCLTVADSGQGMSDEIRERVFEPFFSTKPRGEGTGLGLATVFGIVQAAGGFITVESRLDAGSTFTILLPATDVSSPVATGSVPQTASGGFGETILVAEDEGGVRRLVNRILTRNGYEVLIAESGPDALELARIHEGPIDLLLTDVIMPHMSGKELSARLNASGLSVPTLYMSGYTDQIMTRDGMLSGEEDFISKPFSAEELLSRIEMVLAAQKA
jgi:two-component system cell cycle sensor histidine kinase/response regulator CckA